MSSGFNHFVKPNLEIYISKRLFFRNHSTRRTVRRRTLLPLPTAVVNQGSVVDD